MLKPLPVLDEMPPSVKTQIMRIVEPKDRINCRCLSMSFKSVLDKMMKNMGDLEIELSMKEEETDSFSRVRLLDKTKFYHWNGHVDFKRAISKIIGILNREDVEFENVRIIIHINQNEAQAQAQARSKLYQKIRSNLRAKSLSLMINATDNEIMEIISRFKAKHLESLRIEGPFGESRKMIDIHRFLDMEICKNATSIFILHGFIAQDLNVSRDFQRIQHLRKCGLLVSKITVEDVLKMREMFLTQEHTKLFTLDSPVFDEDALLAEFGPFHRDKENDWKYNLWRFGNGKRKVRIEYQRNLIWRLEFRRIF